MRPRHSNLGDMPTSKNQNPREGIETNGISPAAMDLHQPPSKNQNPREGIETNITLSISIQIVSLTSKNQNPREGIETGNVATMSPAACCTFKKPKSPRGDWNQQKTSHQQAVKQTASKNQNPREGIETWSCRSGTSTAIVSLQKTKIPARGLKQGTSCAARPAHRPPPLQKTKIPARGLKQTCWKPPWVGLSHSFKKPKSPRGDWNHVPFPTYPHAVHLNLQKTKIPARGLKHNDIHFTYTFYKRYFKKPKSPRGDWNRANLTLMLTSFYCLQKTKIPARGLKLLYVLYYLTMCTLFKKPKSPRGDWNIVSV